MSGVFSTLGVVLGAELREGVWVDVIEPTRSGVLTAPALEEVSTNVVRCKVTFAVLGWVLKVALEQSHVAPVSTHPFVTVLSYVVIWGAGHGRFAYPCASISVAAVAFLVRGCAIVLVVTVVCVGPWYVGLLWWGSNRCR